MAGLLNLWQAPFTCVVEGSGIFEGGCSDTVPAWRAGGGAGWSCGRLSSTVLWRIGHLQRSDFLLPATQVAGLVDLWQAPIDTLSKAGRAMEGIEALLGGAAGGAFDLKVLKLLVLLLNFPLCPFCRTASCARICAA